MIDKETRAKKNEILYHSNPKHIAHTQGGQLPHWQGKHQFLYVTDYNKFGISISISGVRGKPYAEIFIDRKHYKDFVEKLMIVDTKE